MSVKSATSLAWAVAVFAGLAVTACAVGNHDDDFDGGLQVDEGEAGSSRRDAGHTPFNEDSGKPASPDDMGDAGGAPDAKAADAGRDGGSKPDAGTNNPASCMTSNSCPSAIDLGVVSGDVGTVTQNGTGTTAKWLSVRVGEDNSSLFGGQKLKLQATLVSPPGVNFDLYMYVNPNSDEQECASILGSSVNTTGSDSATIEWGEGSIPNGSDDGRTVSIEVRYTSGTCDPNTKWTLEVKGNP